MRKRHLLSWFSNDLPNYLLITLSVILLLGGLFSFIHIFYLHEQAEVRHLTIGASWWFEKMARVIRLLTFALWLALLCYKDRLRKKLEIIEHASRIKKVVNAVWWTTVFALALVTVEVFTVFYNNSDKSIFGLIILSLIIFLLVDTLVTSRAERRYFRKQPFCNIVAAALLEKHNKFLDEQDFDNAYNALVKACETVPERTYLWCKLAFFCEEFRKDKAESDKYMTKAKESISAEKAKSNSDKACYFEYLGLINCLRKDLQKGLDFLKQANDIEPKPERTKLYEQLLSESRDEQSSTA